LKIAYRRDYSLGSSSLFDNAATSRFFSSSFLCPPFGKHTFKIPAVKPYSLHRGFNHSGIASNLASRFFSAPASSAQRGLALSKSS
jgi:hypothetical protein